MPSSPVSIAASLACLLAVSSVPARAAGQQMIEPDPAMLAEMEAAPLRDVPAEGAPQMAPAFKASLAGGDWLIQARSMLAEGEAEPVTTTVPESCATAAQLLELLMTPPDIGGLKCTSQARIWARGSLQVWTCSSEDEQFIATRLMVVQGETLSAVDQTSMRDVDARAVDTAIAISATTAHGGACPGVSN